MFSFLTCQHSGIFLPSFNHIFESRATFDFLKKISMSTFVLSWHKMLLVQASGLFQATDMSMYLHWLFVSCVCVRVRACMCDVSGTELICPLSLRVPLPLCAWPCVAAALWDWCCRQGRSSSPAPFPKHCQNHRLCLLLPRFFYGPSGAPAKEK